jgi:hypothetical protein
MKGIDRADQCLSFYLVLRNTVKWSIKVVLYLLNCVLFNAFFCVKDTKYKHKVKYKNFLHEAGRSWISEVQNWSESNSDLQLLEKQTTPRGPKILCCSTVQRVLFWEIPFSNELLDYLHAVSAVWGSGA